MGTFGSGPFENDGAADFLVEAVEAPTRAVPSALRAAAEAPDSAYLDVDVGQAAHAAAEIVAIAFGCSATAESTDASEIASTIKPTDALRLLALRALDRIAGPQSELASLWAEGADGSFRAQIEALRARLVDGKSGARKPPRPKVGDVFEVPHAGETLVVQFVAPREIVVFQGARGGDEALAIAASRTGVRTPCEVAQLTRIGRVVGRVPVRAPFKGKKLYGIEVGSIECYALVNGSHRDWRRVTYDEAREHDLHESRYLDGWARLAFGETPPRPRSPDEREADHRRRSKVEWDRRRSVTGPGPFDDPAATKSLFDHVSKYGAADHLDFYRKAAREVVGGEAEWQYRWTYCQVGLLALWMGRWPTGDVPEALRGEIPPPPEDDVTDCLAGGRALLDRVVQRESELRMLWEEAPDGGASFHAAVAKLRVALAD
jgi:Domain of unknown function (DUF4259)